MDFLYEFRALAILPFLVLLFWAATRGRKRNVQQPAPVAQVQPQQPEDVAREPSHRVDRFIWFILIAAIVFLGFNFLTDPSGSQIPDIASVQRVLSADSIGTLLSDWNTLTGNPDGSRPLGSGTVLVMILVALFAFIFGRRSSRRGNP